MADFPFRTEWQQSQLAKESKVKLSDDRGLVLLMLLLLHLTLTHGSHLGAEHLLLPGRDPVLKQLHTWLVSSSHQHYYHFLPGCWLLTELSEYSFSKNKNCSRLRHLLIELILVHILKPTHTHSHTHTRTHIWVHMCMRTHAPLLRQEIRISPSRTIYIYFYFLSSN